MNNSYKNLHKIAESIVKNGINTGSEIENDKLCNVLYEAISIGRISVVKYLIDHGIDVNGVCEPKSLVEVAISKRSLEITKLLIDNGAKKDSVGKLGNNLLHVAIEYNNSDILEYLLDIGLDIEKTNNSDFTPLQEACRRGYVDKVKILLEKGARVNGISGLSPLGIACCRGDTNMVKILLDHGADILEKDEMGYTAFHLIFFSHASNPNASRSLEILNAKVDILRIFIEREKEYIKLGEFAGKEEETLLHLASLFGKLEPMIMMIDNGANINCVTRKKLSPLCLVSERRETLLSSKMFELLIKKGADVNGEGCCRSPLYISIMNINHHAVKFLLDAGAIIHEGYDMHGKSPAIYHALRMGDYYIIELLLKKGADVNYCDKSGKYLIDHTLFQGCEKFDLVKLMMKYGADISHVSNNKFVIKAMIELRKRKFTLLGNSEFTTKEIAIARTLFAIQKKPHTVLSIFPTGVIKEICAHVLEFDPVNRDLLELK